MATRNDQRRTGSRWHVEDIDFSCVDTARVRTRDDIFLLVCSASFIESGAETYTHNLVAFFQGDDEVGNWLREHWEAEELQHGRALKSYIQHVWPEFDWDGAYADFFAEYGKLCNCEELEPTRGQELVARCIIEMGTTTYYQALNAVSDEPVLRDICWRIRTDEANHYKHFYDYFLKYKKQEKLKRPHVIATLWRRAAELRKSDADVALRHAAAWRFRGYGRAPETAAIQRQVYDLIRARYPTTVAVRMALKPLQLNARLQRWTERPVAALAQRLLLS